MKGFFVCLLFIFLIACSSSSPKQETAFSFKNLGQDLLVQVNPDGNVLGIYNAYDKPMTFNIEPCQFCTFANSTVTIPAKSTATIDFTAKNSGDKTIVIRDKLNNYYSKTSFTVKS